METISVQITMSRIMSMTACGCFLNNYYNAENELDRELAFNATKIIFRELDQEGKKAVRAAEDFLFKSIKGQTMLETMALNMKTMMDSENFNGNV